jgi:general secretion pathway protein E
MSTAQRYVPYAFARDNGILLRPASERDAEAWVSESTPLAALNEVMRVFPGRVTPVMVDPAALREAIAQTYAAGEGSAQQIVGDIEGEFDISRMLAEVPDIEDLLETEDDAPIIRMINALLTQAARDGASDIHIEPFETYSLVRFRVDGTLRDIVRPKRALHAALVSRIKIMAQLDIAEKRLPQDGRITLRVGGRAVDVRVSTLPTGHGERAVLRLLEKDLSKLNLGVARHGRGHPRVLRQADPPAARHPARDRPDRLGQDHHAVRRDPPARPLDHQHHDGRGPDRVRPRRHRPDPGQSEDRDDLRPRLRSILRQDPDVVMVGEIRDLETAQIAVQASLTGHLVLATLHTNDAASAVTRLIDMGIEPFLLSSSLLGVLGQRLVRKLCPHCKKPEPGGNGFVPVGCDRCTFTGYIGRTGIYELLQVDEQMRALIHQGANDTEIRRTAERRGMTSMRADGLRWVAAGVTSHEEVVRVTRE